MSGGADSLVHRVRPASGEPEGALVLLHGRGTSEDDLVPLLDALDPERLLTGVTPRGPISAPPGGAHWYVVRRIGHPDATSFHSTYERAVAFVDALPEVLGVPLERTVLGGFSQGAVMSYALALGAGRPHPAGVLALSGFVPDVDGFELDLDGAEGFPAAIAHGALDPVIGVDFGRAARDRLAAAEAAVTYHEAPVGHEIDPAWIPELAGWLHETLQASRQPG
ncbi:MAG: alpha/beta hydrolase [Thermoleophilaceae bacterium]